MYIVLLPTYILGLHVFTIKCNGYDDILEDKKK